MSTLTKAPLIEAIVEIRWGNLDKNADHPDTIALTFSKEDINFFPGQFHGIAAKNGFTFVETINEPQIPHLVNYRFRKHENTWPCYQIGLGLFTVNQINNGYEWNTFKQDVLAGLQMLDEGHPLTISKLPIIYIELRYQDGFFFEENESPSEFLQKKMNFSFNPPDPFLNGSFLKKNVHGHNIKFQVETLEPPGILRFEIMQAVINSRGGFAMNTIMRSKPPSLDIDLFLAWLEKAHSAQKHAFETLINPSYLESFK